MRLLLASIPLLSLVGCSFTIGNPDPKRPAVEPPRCSTSAPGRKLLDVMGGVSSAVMAYLFLPAEDSSDSCGTPEGHCDSPNVGLPTLGFLALSVAYGSALVVGDRRTDRCAAEDQRYRAWLRRDESDRAREVAADREARRQARRGRCQESISAWRREADRARKTRLLDELSDECRRLVARPQPAGAP